MYKTRVVADKDYFYVQYSTKGTGWLPKEAVWSFYCYRDDEDVLTPTKYLSEDTAIKAATELYRNLNGNKVEYKIVWEHV